MTIKIKKDSDVVVVLDSKPSGEAAAILAKIIKDKGRGVVMRGNEVPKVEHIRTGVFEFDDATNGGIAKNRLNIIYGPESSGKSNVCYGLVREVQSWPDDVANKVVWVDLEGTFDPKWVYQFGIDLDTLIVVKPGYGEEAADLIDALLAADDVALVIIDSIAVLTSAREVEASTEKADVGTSPMLVKRICNKIAMTFSRENRRDHHPTVVFVNQTRMKIGAPPGHNPETMPGGKTMMFMASLIVRLSGTKVIEKSIHPDLPAVMQTRMTVKKSKIPVNSVATEYEMLLIPQPDLGLCIGDTASWNYVSGYLKSIDVLVKAPGSGWLLWDEKFPTLVPIQERYYTDPKFKVKCQDAVIKDKASKSFLVDPKEN